MKKQHFTKFCLGIALVLGSSAVHAQATDFKLEKLEAFPIPTFSWDTPAPQRGIAKEVANTPQPGQAYGDWLVEWHKQQGLPMPFPEEKMRQFHRSTRRVEANAQGKPLEFLGFLQYNMLPNNHMALDYGFYRVSSANNWARTLEADLDMCVNGGAVYLDHKIMGMGNLSIKDYDYSRHYFCEWDADTYQPTERHRSNSSEAVLWGRLLNQACFHDPVSDRVLTFNRFSGGTTVAEVDLETLTISELATLDKNVCAAACDKYGNAYVITSDGYLNKFDLDTYEVIPVGQLDFSWGFMLQSLAFDNNTDKLYFACSEYIEETDELLGRFCEVDPNTGSTTLIGYFPEDEEYTNMYFPYVPEDSAPGKIADLSLSFKDATGHGVLSWTMPSLSYDNKTLNGVINYEIYINNDEENPLTGSAAPGASISKDIDFDLGNAKAVVLLSNTTGNGVRNPIASYAGEDTPMATDIAFSYDEATGVATLNWACAGSNGGYVDADKAVYDILRYPGPTLVAHDIAGTSFTETFDNPDWDTYYYRINAHIDNNYGEKQYSNSLQFGQPIELPFQSAFDDESDFGLFTAIDANNDDQTWHWGTYYEDYGVYYSYNHNGTPADDWLLTPPFQVEADCTYSLTVSQSAMNEPWVEKMQVFLGYGDDPTQYSALTDVMTITNTMFEPETVTYTGAAENDGVMRFAIHCTSDSYMNTLFLDNLTIKAGVHAHAPAPVDNLVVSPAEEGELAVNLSFTAPTLDATGNPLNGLDKIEIYRGEVLAGTIAPAEPGIDYTFVDEDAVNGLSDYTVLAYNEYGKGQSNTVTIYAGYDAPLAPSAIYFCDNLDGTITISWDEPIIGQNGGFVDLDEVSYVLMVPDGNGSYKEIVSNEQREYTCANYLIDGVQSVFTVGVSAVNEFGSSDFTIDSYIQGKPYGVPFEEGYVSGKMNLWLASNDGSAVEMVLFSGESPDGDGSMTGAYSEDGAGWAALTSGKISLDGTTVPKLHFFFIGFAGVDNQLSVLVNACGKKGFDEVLTIDQKDLSQTAWYDVTIDLAPYKDYPYIIIRFKAQVNDADYYIVFDDLYVGDVVNDNLAVKVEATPHITTGGIAKINAIVHNVGENSAQNYSVNFLVNDRLVKTLQSSSALDAFDRQQFVLDYETQVWDAQSTEVMAEVVYAQDQIESDNCSDIAYITVAPKLMVTIDDLAAENVNAQTRLSWSAPSAVNRVTDSFEGYESFSIDNFGDWTVYDGDGESTYYFSTGYPNYNSPKAFMTVDFGYLGYDLEANPSLNAHSGSQFMASFVGYPSLCNDDWLISPELSGDAQTIQLYLTVIRTLIEEDYEILYSTTDSQPSSFVSTGVSGALWSSDYELVTVDLPEGTKYFAIRIQDYCGWACGVDDVTFETKPLTLEGYNVYQDDELIATLDKTETSYSLGIEAENGTKFNVTPIYAEGEANYSNDAIIGASGAVASATRSIVNITSAQGKILVSDYDGSIAITNMAGILVYKDEIHGQASISAAPGVYVVVFGENAMKVVVR